MKFCEKCGAQIPEGSFTCPACSLPVPVTVEPDMHQMPNPFEQPTIAPTIQMDSSTVQQQNTMQPTPIQPNPIQQNTVQQNQIQQNTLQPNYTAPVMPPPVVETKQKKHGVPVIIVLILLIIVAASGVFLGKMYFSESNCKQQKCDINDLNNNEDENDQHNIEAPEKEETEVSSIEETYLGGHKIQIPAKYQYEIDEEDILYMYEESSDWTAELTITKYVYDTVTSNINTMVESFKTNGFTVENFEEKTISGKNLHEIKVMDSNGIKIIAAYVKISETHIGVITVYNKTSKEYEIEKFEEAVEIIANAEKATSSKNNNYNLNDTILNALQIE